VCVSLNSCVTYRKNVKHVRANPTEIVAFKKYLEDNYQLNSFSEYETIWGTYKQTDTIISKFCSENRIISIVKLPQDKNSHFYNKHGNIVQLYFQRVSFIEKVQSIIFDYSEEGFEAYDTEYKEAEIAEGIYIFD
jgi:hypothetical protein